MMQFKKANIIKTFWPLFAVYILTLGIRVYWLSQKNGFHVDEAMTLTISSYKGHIIGKNFETNRVYTGKEAKETSLVGNTSLKETLDDLKKLWKDNRDPPHTSLYYSLLRIFLTKQKTSDIKQIIIRGGSLNLLLFTLSFIFFYLLMKNLFPGQALFHYTALSCAFLSSASISNTLFLRPYQIQETMFIVFCYYFIKTLDYEKHVMDNDKRYISQSLVLFSLITAITLMSGYYAVFFIGLFGLYAVHIKCKERKYSEIKFYFLTLFQGVLFAQAFYLKFLDGFSSYRAAETARTVSGNIWGNLKNSMLAAGTLAQKHFFTLPMIILCAVCLLYALLRGQKLTAPKHSLFIFISAAAYFLVTLIIAPYKILRYGMPIFPFFAILPVVILNSTLKKKPIFSLAAVILLLISFLPGAINQNKIENLFKAKPDEYIFSKERDIPVYVYMHYYASWNYMDLWKYANLVPYLNDDQKYYFITDYEDLHTAPYGELYLVMENFWGLSESGYLNDPAFEILEEVKLTGGEPETPGGLGFYYLCRKLKFRD